MARGSVGQGLVLGPELLTAPGVGVAGTKQFQAFRMRPSYEVAQETLKASGSKVATAVMTNTELARWSVEGFQCYNHLAYVWASVFGVPAVVTPGGGTLSREWTFLPRARKEDVAQTYTAYFGDDFETFRGRHLYFTEYGVDVKRAALGFNSAAVSYSLEENAIPPKSEQQTITFTSGPPTSGTFTLSWSGQTTATIPFNATAAAVEAALIALTNIEPGDVIVTGGPAPGTPFVVTFKGRLGSTDVAQLTANAALLTPATTITITSTRAANTPANIAPVTVAPRTFTTYADDSWASIGTTPLAALYQANPSWGGKYAMDWPVNAANPSFAGLVEAEDQTATFNMVVGVDATSRSLLGTWRNNAYKFFRIESVGPIIEGVLAYCMRLDFAVLVTNPTELGATDSVQTLGFNSVMAEDPTTGNYARGFLRNTLTAL